MKYKRQKKVKGILKAFKQIGIEPPYKVVLDGTLTMAALNHKVNLSEQIPSYFGVTPEASYNTSGAMELCTTKCVIKELEKLGSYFFGALHILKQFSVVKCAHSRKKLKGAVTCLKNLAEDEETKYIYATQDKVGNGVLSVAKVVLQDIIEKCHLPLLYLHNATLVLKKPTFLTESNQPQNHSEDPGKADLDKLAALKSKEGLLDVPVSNPAFEKRKEKLLKKIERRKQERLQARENKKMKFLQPRHSMNSVLKQTRDEQENSSVKSRCRNRKKRHTPKLESNNQITELS